MNQCICVIGKNGERLMPSFPSRQGTPPHTGRKGKNYKASSIHDSTVV